VNSLSNLQLVLLGTSLLGAVAGVVGSFAVLRRRALMGDLLSHAALPGICLAYLLLHGKHFSAMLLGAALTGLLGVATVTAVCRWTRIKEDAAMGIVLSTFFGFGVVLISLIQNLPNASGQSGVQSFIFGEAASIVHQDVWTIALVAVICLLAVLLLYKEFKVFSFDPEFAQTQGWPTLVLDLVMMGALTLVTVAGLPAVGAVLMAAMLLIPGAAARFWTNRLGIMLVLSGVFGALAGVGGTLLSSGLLKEWFGRDPLAFGYTNRALPTGPVIVLVVATIFLLSMFFAPKRGLAARVVSAWQLRRRTARENLLRTMYELSEPCLPEVQDTSVAELVEHRAWSPHQARSLLRQAASQNLVMLTPQGGRLTEAGLERAQQLTRAHRLWELFLIQGADIAPDHVDRDADSVEHFLSPEIIRELEARLHESGRISETTERLPVSPHELTGIAPAHVSEDQKSPSTETSHG
jgi:manganese/zinc/iron transport system permease protein